MKIFVRLADISTASRAPYSWGDAWSDTKRHGFFTGLGRLADGHWVKAPVITEERIKEILIDPSLQHDLTYSLTEMYISSYLYTSEEQLVSTQSRRCNGYGNGKDSFPKGLFCSDGEPLKELHGWMMVTLEVEHDYANCKLKTTHVHNVKIISMYSDQQVTFSDIQMEDLSDSLKMFDEEKILGSRKNRFIRAVYDGDLTTVKILLENDLNIRNGLNCDNSCGTGLDLTFKAAHPALYQAFSVRQDEINHGVCGVYEINVGKPYPVLHFATLVNNQELIDLLMDYGASPDVKANGFTPLQIAEKLGIQCFAQKASHLLSSAAP